MKRQYELTLLFSPVLAPEKREELAKKILQGMKIVDSTDMGSLDLAYSINKQKKAYFVRYVIEGEAEDVVKMKEMLKLIEGILRYLLIKN